MANLILAVGGAVVGGFFGGPLGAQLGWALGATAGAAMATAQKNQGPRLNDLRVTGTEYGQPIPWVQGHPVLAGQIWWASDRREISTTTSAGGKGSGPSVETTTFTYEVDLLVGLTDDVIADVTRVWLNGKLVWSKLASLTYEGPSGQTTVTPGIGTIFASDTTDLWKRMTVYGGAATQLPDPVYEAAVGTANAPAYRGRGSVFIEGLQLGGSGQLPNLTFEVATSATESGDAELAGHFLLAHWYPRSGPLYAGPNGLVLHSLTFDPFDANLPLTVGIEQLTYDGSNSIIGQYSHSTATLVGDFAGNVDSGVLWIYKGPAGSGKHEVFDDSGSGVEVTPTDHGMVNFRFARRAGVIYFGGGGAASSVIYRSAAGPITATSAALSDLPLSVAATAGSVYVLVDNSASLVELNPTTLALVSTIALPTGAAPASLLLVNEADELFYAATIAGTGVLYKYAGGAWTQLSSNLGLCSPEDQRVGTTQGDRLAVRGDTVYRVVLPTAGDGTNTAPVYRSISMATPLNETLANVVSRLCVRAGLTVDQFDVTALASITKPVRALAVSQVSNTRSGALEMLMSAYFFESVLSDKLYFRPRGGASAVTIPYADLGASTEPSGAAEPLALRPANELEIPAQVALSYFNIDREYQTDTQFSDRLISSSAGTVAAVQLALGFNPAEAKGIANAMVMDQIASWLTTKIAVPAWYAKYEPTDVVTVVAADGSTVRMRLVKKNEAGGVLMFDAVSDDVTVLTHSGITMVDYVPSITVPLPPASRLEVMDIPILRDADNDVGLYAAVRGETAPYPGAVVLSSRDNVLYTEAATVLESATLGSCTTTLGTWLGGNEFDEVNTVTVDVGPLGTLASVTRDELLQGASNACLVGSEILLFRVATLVSTGVYTLSGLLRGRRGTELLMAHVANERFVLLQPRGMRRAQMQSSDIGAARYFRAVTLGRRLSSGDDKTVTFASIGSKPFAPVDLRAARDAATGDITLTWKRRSRLSGRFVAAGVDAPLGEASESYVVEIWNSTFTTLKRTIGGLTSPAAAYSSANQVADFGSNQSTVYARVYQISQTVGRGYALEAFA